MTKVPVLEDFIFLYFVILKDYTMITRINEQNISNTTSNRAARRIGIGGGGGREGVSFGSR